MVHCQMMSISYVQLIYLIIILKKKRQKKIYENHVSNIESRVKQELNEIQLKHLMCAYLIIHCFNIIYRIFKYGLSLYSSLIRES